MISLCTGSPPGELTETARATALEVLISDNLLATLSVLRKIRRKLQILFNDSVNVDNWDD